MQCDFDDQTPRTGVTHLKLCGWKLIVGRIGGQLDLFRIGALNVTRRSFSDTLGVQHFEFELLQTLRAHQQPITCLLVDHGTILTGSQDHTLKIFRVDDSKGSCTGVYTLHGHCGPVTSAFIDRTEVLSSAGSGSQDGMLCLWDVMTGACLYSIQAHDGCVISMTHSPSYVVSMGSDEKLCVWERLHGHLINTISLVSFLLPP